MRLEDLSSGVRVVGLEPDTPVTVVAVEWHGADAATVTYRSDGAPPAERLVYRHDEADLRVEQARGRAFDAPADEFRLAAEADRIRLAGLFDPMVAVSTSDVQPLPHQIRAVYGELLPRTPLRFLLADDPGAGKTIMAGLYIKELLLRGDVDRCLIVAPGGLVEQWQDELILKFGLDFEILTADMLQAAIDTNVFERHPMVIARMDQLSRSDDLMHDLRESEWDLVVVDEAHRMSARHFGGKLEKTKRFLLGELLGDIARHLLLMTATPHAGKEADFQQFMTLLDRDRFEGRYQQGVHSADTTGLMRRMVKEDLLTFEGKALFPDRVAETVPYDLSPAEYDLYDHVTAYVRDEMNRAQRLTDGRRNTVGFALTVLQRRLASSPEAIYQSLARRHDRLVRRREEIATGGLIERTAYEVPDDLSDEEDLSAFEREALESALVDAASASQTIEEVDHEIAVVRGLVARAATVRAADTDRKWSELRAILADQDLLSSGGGTPRKLIVFTEHRDTLDYLQRKIRALLGRHEAVAAIHGGVNRAERRRVTEEFTENPDCQVLVATDAAGEGLNLQAAHLMVNYDLPWNPNRLEQRFGRIHRIGQQVTCHLWNLVAAGTREGEVYLQLLDKVEQQRKAYGGKVFEVLGDAFQGRPLRELMLEAIRYGDDPQVRARLHETVDATISEGLPELLQERALASETMPQVEVEALRRSMEEARARRMQPYYIQRFFQDAFARLGGRIAKRETGRFEISHVPAQLRSSSRLRPIATRYERVTFEIEHMQPAGLERAALLAPGHPLMDAVVRAATERWGETLLRGTTLVDPDVLSPTLLVGAMESAVDGSGSPVRQRFTFTYSDVAGSTTGAGPAPYLDLVGAPDDARVRAARTDARLDQAEGAAKQWIITQTGPEFVAEVATARAVDVERSRRAVEHRLLQEINRLDIEALEAADAVQHGKQRRRSADTLSRQSAELRARLDRRLTLLQRQTIVRGAPPRIHSVALVLPESMVAAPGVAVSDLAARKVVERRAVDLVLATERQLGREPEEMPFLNGGYDVRSPAPDGGWTYIEVKGRMEGADSVKVSTNEILFGKNNRGCHRLAVVRVSPRGPQHDEVRYVVDAFEGIVLGGLATTSVDFKWEAAWAAGKPPW